MELEFPMIYEIIFIKFHNRNSLAINITRKENKIMI